MSTEPEPRPAPPRRPWDASPGRWAIAALVAGILLGAGTILVPGLHLVGTWACPLLGAAAAMWLWTRATVV